MKTFGMLVVLIADFDDGSNTIAQERDNVRQTSTRDSDGSANESSNSQVLVSGLQHLRSGEEREWTEFPEHAPPGKLVEEFVASQNDAPRSIRLRQQDVKGAWQVVLNNQTLGRLTNDENDVIVYFDIEAGVLKKNNTITIQPVGSHKASDDIRVGEITLLASSRSAALTQSHLRIRIHEDGKPSPGRITILNADGAMASIGTPSNAQLAVRPGTVYTSTGEANIKLPAGSYELIASRGLEYSIARANVVLVEGDQTEVPLAIRREVNTSGWVACDTHIHTLTHSLHGDATVEERMITLAGEGIELPIATDHNRHIDYESSSREANVRTYFTLVVGIQLTASVAALESFDETVAIQHCSCMAPDRHRCNCSMAPCCRTKQMQPSGALWPM